MHYARCYDPQLTANGGMSVEIALSQAPNPLTAPGGPRTEWSTAADMAQQLAASEAIVAEHLGFIRLAKHWNANSNNVNASLLNRINNDPEPDAKLDLSGIAGVVVP
jgi:hypothetical protein